MTYHLWKSMDGYTLVNSKVETSDWLLGENAKLVLIFEADSFDEAIQTRNEHLGWNS